MQMAIYQNYLKDSKCLGSAVNDLTNFYRYYNR